MSNIFKIADRSDDALIVESDYYQWLKKKGNTCTYTKREYLAEKGFVMGRDKITSKDYHRLDAIESFYNSEKRQNFNISLTELFK